MPTSVMPKKPISQSLPAVTSKFHWIHWFVLTASFILTLTAWFITSQQSQQKMELQYQFQAKYLVELVQERMGHYADALWSGTAAIKLTGNNVSAAQWKTYSDVLSLGEKYPGINGIGIIYHVEPEVLDSFLAVHQQERDYFTIHPSHNNPEYWPITYIEPLVTNLEALGLDMAHESNRLNAAKQARDRGEAQITAPIVLVQDSQKTPGFLFYAPFYKTATIPNSIEDRRLAFTGNVYAPFIMKNLMDGALENKDRLLNFSIKDGNDLLYDELSSDSVDYDPTPMFSKRYKIDLYGRTWEFEIHSSLLFREQYSNNQPTIILIAGIFIEVMLFTLFIILVKGNRRAMAYAEVISNDLIHEQQHLSEQEAMLSAAIHSSISGFAIGDVRGQLTEVNAGLAEWLGYLPEELIGQPIEILVPEHEQTETTLGLKKLRDGEVDSIRREKQYRRKDGSLVWGLLSASSIRSSSGEIISLFAQILDIDHAKRLSLQLETRNTELVRSNAELDQFAYVASHDLRAPLNAINKLAGWIEEDCGDVLPDSARQHFELLKSRSVRMGKLLEDLLLYSRVGRVEYQIENIDLKPLVLDIISLMDISSGFTVTVNDINLRAEKTPFEQVLRNLIGNAVKHHPNNTGNIAIYAEKTPTGFTLKVADDGQGIPDNLHDKALEMFQTLRPRDEIEGSGLGLALCKKIVEYSGGTLHIEPTKPDLIDKPNHISADNVGTTIIIFLPIPQDNVV